MANERDILPDLIESDLRVLFCGTAVGVAAAENGGYYAHSNNIFWKIIAETGLVPHRIPFHEYRSLLQYRIGITDLVKDEKGNDGDVRRANDADRKNLRDKLERYTPLFFALTSKEAGKQFLGSATVLGEQNPIGKTRVFVLPSTSLTARWQWNETVHVWHEFANAVLRLAES